MSERLTKRTLCDYDQDGEACEKEKVTLCGLCEKDCCGIHHGSVPMPSIMPLQVCFTCFKSEAPKLQDLMEKLLTLSLATSPLLHNRQFFSVT